MQASWHLALSEAIHGAWALLQAEGVKAHLIGTAGLMMHGYDVPVDDVDFLCETMPTCGRELPGVTPPAYADQERSREMNIGGVKVNFITAGDSRAPFLSSSPVIIENLPVAPVDYILHLKKRAGRDKDHVFFRQYRDLAKLVSYVPREELTLDF